MSINELNCETKKLLNTTQTITSISSVVKELIENALDAEADQIEISLEGNGLSSIRVADNGTGIFRENAPFMARQSCTSKIRDYGDLQNLKTYGFRGAALHAMCAVGEVRVLTKTLEDETARFYCLDDNGKIVSEENVTHSNLGTIVTVRNFMQRVEVRRKFISQKKVIDDEIANIENLVRNYAILKFGVQFKLTKNGRVLIHKRAEKSVESALRVVFGSNMENLEFLEQNVPEKKLKISMLVPKRNLIDLAKIPLVRNMISVNCRPVQHRKLVMTLNRRIVGYFKEKNMSVSRAFFFLSVSVDPEKIDVNVEPNKNKICLEDNDGFIEAVDEILRIYYEGLGEVLRSQDAVDLADFPVEPYLPAPVQSIPLNDGEWHREMALDKFLMESWVEAFNNQDSPCTENIASTSTMGLIKKKKLSMKPKKMTPLPNFVSMSMMSIPKEEVLAPKTKKSKLDFSTHWTPGFSDPSSRGNFSLFKIPENVDSQNAIVPGPKSDFDYFLQEESQKLDSEGYDFSQIQKFRIASEKWRQLQLVKSQKKFETSRFFRNIVPQQSRNAEKDLSSLGNEGEGQNFLR